MEDPKKIQSKQEPGSYGLRKEVLHTAAKTLLAGEYLLCAAT